MMGERDPQAPLWSYRVNLEKRVRRDHPLRRINQVLDLSFVRGQVAHTYGRRGNKSVPPEVVLRMMLLLFLDETTTGAVDEGQRLLELIQAHEDVTQQQVQTVIADSRYGTTRNLLGCQARGIRPHLAVLAEIQTSAGQRAKIYSERMFLYQPQSNTYLCPAGQIMHPRRCHPTRLTWEYVTAKGTCLGCALRALCTRSKSGRTIHRHRDQALLDRAKRQAASSAALADRKRRQHLMERSFADATNCHGFKRARWRGLWRQTIQDLLIATAQNLRKLVKELVQYWTPTSWAIARRLRQLTRELTALANLSSRVRAPLKSPFLGGGNDAFAPEESAGAKSLHS